MPDGHAPRRWSLQDAKARFSALVREAQANGPQLVTLHGRDAVVVLSAAEYARLLPPAAPSKSIVDLFGTGPFAELAGFDELLAESRAVPATGREPFDFSTE